LKHPHGEHPLTAVTVTLQPLVSALRVVVDGAGRVATVMVDPWPQVGVVHVDVRHTNRSARRHRGQGSGRHTVLVARPEQR
jgi:hypothetical protein